MTIKELLRGKAFPIQVDSLAIKPEAVEKYEESFEDYGDTTMFGFIITDTETNLTLDLPYDDEVTIDFNDIESIEFTAPENLMFK